MSHINQMAYAPRELLEQALDAAAAVGMQDVADELERILTPPTTERENSTAVLWRHREQKPGRVWNYTNHREIATKAIRLGHEVQAFSDSRETERLSEENLHYRNLQIEADDLITSLRAQLAAPCSACSAASPPELTDVLPTAAVEGDQLVIRITTECLLHAVTCAPEWPVDYTGTPISIQNGTLLIQEMINELQREDEQGTNQMHRLLDQAALDAINNGSEAVSYD